MTKEELEKEAEKWLRKFLLCNDCKRKCHCIELNAYCEEQVLKAYIDSAKPREKRIAELEAENEQIKNSDTLCKLIGEQKIKIAELEAQIEKMKCCYNCKHSRTEYEHCRTDKHEKWEIKENGKY